MSILGFILADLAVGSILEEIDEVKKKIDNLGDKDEITK